ncbi:hypothetical protein [Nocardia nepalensis]|uniref:hypothetical protein n=1 Tax=Nocardia nepalensis TaxID=3375448 RepID=UPI003B6733BB
MKRYSNLVSRVAASHGYPTIIHPIDVEAGLREMAEAEADRTVKWEAVLLLGSPQAVEAGRRWHKAVVEMSWVARGQEVDHVEYIRRLEETGRRRNEFYDCARADLGVRSGALPPGDQAWLPPTAAPIAPGVSQSGPTGTG